METINIKKKFNIRAFISSAMFAALLILPISGYIVHQLNGPLNQTKHLWMSIHNSASILFLILGLIHIGINWKALKKYITTAKSLVISKEALMGIGIIVAVVALFSSHAFHI